MAPHPVDLDEPFCPLSVVGVDAVLVAGDEGHRNIEHGEERKGRVHVAQRHVAEVSQLVAGCQLGSQPLDQTKVHPVGVIPGAVGFELEDVGTAEVGAGGGPAHRGAPASGLLVLGDLVAGTGSGATEDGCARVSGFGDSVGSRGALIRT